jgi:TRAP-type transport system periplasmic protein
MRYELGEHAPDEVAQVDGRSERESMMGRTTMRRTRAVRVTSVLTGLALIAVACGGATEEAPEDPTPEAAADPDEQEPTVDEDAEADDVAADTESCEDGIEGRIAHHLGDTVVGHEAFEILAEEVAEATDGRITFEVFPGGQLGGIAEWVDMLRDGVIEMAWLDASHLGAFAFDVGAPNLPFLFETDDDFHRIMDGDIGADMNALILEEARVEVLGWSSVGALYPFFSGLDPVTTPEDLRGLRMRIAEAPVSIRAWELLGTEPVGMPLGEAYTALQTGAVDGYHLPYWATRATSMYEVSDSMSEIPVTFANLAIAVDPQWLGGLCEHDAEVIRVAAKNAETFNREGWPEADVEDREFLIE